MTKKKPLLNWSLTFIAIASIGYGLYHYKSSEIKTAMAQTQPEFPSPINAVTVDYSDYKERVTVPAEIVAPESLMLTNNFAGKITYLDLQSGSVVKKGQKLLQVDISEELAQLKTAKARSTLANNELARAKELHRKKLASDAALDQAQADAQINQAEVARIQAIISKKTIYAPFDGIVGLHTLSVGEYLAPNSQVANLVTEQPLLWVDFDLSQVQSQRLSGDKVEMVIENHPKTEFANIIAKEPVVNAQTRGVKYRAELQKTADMNLSPGTFVEVKLQQGQSKPKIKLPKHAVLRQQSSRFVYVLVPEKEGTYRAQRRDVSVFQDDSEFSYVSSGLKVGEQVVSSGAFKLYPNQLVSIKQADAQATK
ncbi:efflux RND transporter periplasmic adaptor subunit [Parashewanella curva]|uniref:Efflux RND transporter periplasmic adaptor subunit n=1 Tax=Parashewanella curva TaxID=2338552 RepID=A0A3L8Q3V3_9GAMM|nr:efflux RND transporter periplasmic adaptor subunit [Parashewanella curva]RLV61652.1 efflux RND transporter periplasmic adaptor subunit [Parashewanella curva]